MFRVVHMLIQVPDQLELKVYKGLLNICYTENLDKKKQIYHHLLDYPFVLNNQGFKRSFL